MIDQVRRKIPGRPLLKVDEMELLEGDFGYPEECNSYPESVAAIVSKVPCYKLDSYDPKIQEKEIALDEVAATRKTLDDAIGAASVCGFLGASQYDIYSDSDSDSDDEY